MEINLPNYKDDIEELTKNTFVLKADMTEEQREAFREAWEHLGNTTRLIIIPTSFDLQPLTEAAYVLKADISIGEQMALKRAWERINEGLAVRKQLILMAPYIDVEPLRKSLFNFATALRLLDMGYEVERDTWTQGHIFKVGNVIKQSHDGKEWIPTQGAIRAVNWRIAVKGEAE